MPKYYISDHELVYGHRFEQFAEDGLFAMQCKHCHDVENPSDTNKILLAILRKTYDQRND